MNEIERALERKREQATTFRERTRFMCGRLREAGYPEIAGRLETGLLLMSAIGPGNAALTEIEGLLEVLDR
jgi:hypothetical protein